MATEGTKDFVRVILAWLLPPLGVFLQVGLGLHFWISLVLTFFGFVPGIVHACWVIANVGEAGQPAEDGTRTFISLLLGALLPPAGVFLKRGVGLPLVISVVLTILFWIPGMVHAAWEITKGDDAAA